jgi:hypothetical protein
LPDQEQSEYEDIIQALDDRFIKNNNRFNMLCFRKTKPVAGELLQAYVDRLKPLARIAGFNEESIEEQIISMIAEHTANHDLKAKALRNDVTLAQLLDWQGLQDTASEWLNVTMINDASTINRLDVNATANSGESRRMFFQKQHSNKSKCRNCGGDFSFKHKEQCPALKATCRACSRKGHYAKYCMVNGATYSPKTKQGVSKRSSHNTNYNNYNNYSQRTSKTLPRNNEAARNLQENKQDSDNEYYSAIDDLSDYLKENVRQISGIDDSPRVMLKIAGSYVDHILDTGSTVNIMSHKVFKSLENPPRLNPTKTKVRGYNNTVPLAAIGEFWTTLNVGNKCTRAKYIVVKDCAELLDNLLSHRSSVALGLVKFNAEFVRFNQTVKCSLKETIIKQYPNVFSGKIGKLVNFQVHLEVDESIKPTQQTHFPLPFNYLEPTKEKIDFLLENDIIERVKGKYTWLFPMLPVNKTKPGANKLNIRITANCKQVNNAVIPQKYSMPNVLNLKYDLNGCNWFTKN